MGTTGCGMLREVVFVKMAFVKFIPSRIVPEKSALVKLDPIKRDPLNVRFCITDALNCTLDRFLELKFT